MSNAPASPSLRTRSQLDDRNARKRSFGRMFDRIRTALRRRESDDGHNTLSRETTTDSTMAESEIPRTYVDPLSLLAVDDEENLAGEADEAIVPLGLLGRRATGISEAKARQFFQQHGLTYNAHQTTDEPAAKLRRVEKPVRMRVRWTCHSCRSVFGVEKYCPGCGHRRCFECNREPGRKVKVSELREATEATSLAIRSGASTAVQPVSPNIIHAVETVKPPQGQSWQCTIQIGRPRTDSYLVSHSESSDHSRHCHHCETTITNSSTHCGSCQHEICQLCPMLPEITAQPTPMTVPVVERVYKKPRQRVRYNCENCNVQFTDRHECSGCGHERCENCPRFPPRKQKHVHDTAAWAAVQAKMAMVATTPSMTVPDTTLAIMETPHARL